MPRTMKRPIGRPTTIDDIVAYTDDGIPVTAAERIIRTLETGEYLTAACDAALTDGSTVRQWIDAGAEAARKRSRGDRLTANERRYLAFSLEVEASQARGRERLITALANGATVGAVKTSTSVKTNKNGDVIETIERTENIPPDLGIALEMVARRWPKEWGRKEQIEVTGEGGGPVQVASPLVEIVGMLDAMDRRHHAIEAMSRELAPADEGDDGDPGASDDTPV